MRPSVIEFRTCLFAHSETGAMPLPALREEVLVSHEAIEDEESRVELMRLFNLVADLVESHRAGEGATWTCSGHTGRHRFGNSYAQRVWPMARSIARGLLRITDREVEAGRMEETDEIRHYALGDDHAFDAYLTAH
ncbi:hypothetical protein Q4F19_08170 [Sphingomonas sp. BIUV-7]|uniref:Uncharacterized protein n=1 Tax=Sphingomonas natans TaxID=3063330 RepID=A0ABT8Y7Q7_9SPHN|nr:hypothetical protein [Sphingomonas sp. BIUV-7]MDO6414353.1 hypothetical protein [Sphingomonas sp. BIUV-7]